MENRTILHHLLMTPQGEEILKLLAAEFDGSCYAKSDPHHTAYLEGRRDVITYLKEVKENARPASIRNTRSSTGSTSTRKRPGTSLGADPVNAK